MKMKFLNFFCVIAVFLLGNDTLAQTGINTRDPYKSAAIDINTPNKGFLITRVPLTSKADVTTVPNPLKGMVVIASQNSLPAIRVNEKVGIGRLYKFNGSQWEEILEEEKPAFGIIFPEVVAYGQKISTTTDISGTSTNNFALETINKYRPGVVLNADGSLTADRDGYYNWSAKIFFFARNSSASLPLGHFSPANIVYSFETAADATSRASQTFSVSGTVYLNAGQTSNPFTWKLIDNAGNSINAVTGDFVGKQTIIWLYAGN